MTFVIGYRGTTLLLLLASVFGIYYWVATVVYGVDLRPRAVYSHTLDPPEHDHVGVSRRVVVRQLQVVQKQLANAILNKQPPTERVLKQIHELIRRLEPQVDVDTVQPNYTEVCPESYQGPDKGWVTENCTQAKPLHELIEVVLYYPVCNSSRLTTVLHGIYDTYPEITVSVAVNEDVQRNCANIISNFPKVLYTKAAGKKPGVVWNELVSMVSSPYILIGRDLDYFTSFSNLERQIRVFGTVQNVQVVGGAFRNNTGHWRVGCFQLDVRNYALNYQDGYFVSRNECMFCDHLLGSFVTRTEILKDIPFDGNLPASVIFEDWFLKLRNEQMYAMNCPDVMYFSSDPIAEAKVSSPNVWLPLARKWELNRLTWPPGQAHTFTCEEAGLSCKNITAHTKFYLMPHCCIEELVRGLRFLHEFFSNRSLGYEVFAGSALGAVKMADVIPWDLDGDIQHYASNHSIVKGAKRFFARNGFCPREFESPVFNGTTVQKPSYAVLYTPHLYIEMFGYKSLSKDLAKPSELRHMALTKVNIHGVWVNGPVNPGLYSRNRYGVEMLQHAQSWRHRDKTSSYDPYVGGHFNPCPRHHHACLDQFPPDGSLNFKVA